MHKINKQREIQMAQAILRIKENGDLESIGITIVMPDFKQVSAREELTTEQKNIDPARYIVSKAKKIQLPVELVTCVSSDPKEMPRQFIAIRP